MFCNTERTQPLSVRRTHDSWSKFGLNETSRAREPDYAKQNVTQTCIHANPSHSYILVFFIRSLLQYQNEWLHARLHRWRTKFVFAEKYVYTKENFSKLQLYRNIIIFHMKLLYEELKVKKYALKVLVLVEFWNVRLHLLFIS